MSNRKTDLTFNEEIAQRHRAKLDKAVASGKLLPLGEVEQSNATEPRVLPDVDGKPLDLSATTFTERVEFVLERLRELPQFYYQSGTNRVAVIIEDAPNAIDRQGPRIFNATTSLVQRDLEQVARFWTFNEKREKMVYTVPPIPLARFPLENPSETRLRELVGLVSHPFMRKDGTFLEAPGYDPSSGYYHSPVTGLDVAEEPTKADAEQAVCELLALLEEFPFEDKEDRSSVLAAILSAFCTQAHACTPAIAFDASKAGSGKTYLMDLVSIIATGQEAGKLKWNEAAGEIDKLVATKLDAGCEIIAFDNLDGPIKATATLEIALTTGVFESRRLGANELIRVPWSHLLILTGNNIQIVRPDMVRRIGMYARLLPPDANSHLREADSFKIGDLKEYAIANRSRLASASITILKAHQLAGAPAPTQEGYKLLGTFEAWGRRIDGALNWLGLPAARRFPEGEDEQTAALIEVLHALKTRVISNGGPVLAAELVRVSQRADSEEDKALRDALLALCGKSNVRDLTKNSLGMALRQHLDTPTEVGTLRREQHRNKTWAWFVESASE